MRRLALALTASLGMAAATAHAETSEEWIALGTRVHGGFGAFIPVGIRIGLDALERLKAGPREVTVLYFDGEKAPCACFVDGIMLATVASPGQRTLQIAGEKAPAGALAVVVVRHRKTGEAVQYTIPDNLLPKLGEWNKTLDPKERYDEAMKAEGTFTAVAVK